MNRKPFKPVYGRDHPKTQKVLKKNQENNPSVTLEDAKRWKEMEDARRASGDVRDWGRNTPYSDSGA